MKETPWKMYVGINPAAAESRLGDTMPRITTDRSHISINFSLTVDIPVGELLDLVERPDYDRKVLLERIRAEVGSLPEIWGSDGEDEEG